MNNLGMDRLKDQLSDKLAKLGQLGQSITSSDTDAMMDDMEEFVLSPYECASTSNEQLYPTKKQTRSLPRTDPTNDNTVIESIDAAYFVEDDFNAIDYELRKLPTGDLYPDDLDRERLRLKSQLQVVSKRISTLILEKSPSYSTQMESIAVIREELGELVVKVRTIRVALGSSKQRTANALRILANEKKKTVLYRLKATLGIVHKLYETEFRIREQIEEGNFPKAIEQCCQVQEAAAMYSHFRCVSDLMSKLEGTTEIIEAELSKALSVLTLQFDQDRYSFVCTAYAMLGKQDVAAQKLVDAFMNSIGNSARSVLLERARVNMDSTDPTSYEDLIKIQCLLVTCSAEVLSSRRRVPDDKLLDVFQLGPGDVDKFVIWNSSPTIMDIEDLTGAMKRIGLVLCKILSFYHAMLRCHIEEDERLALASDDSAVVPGVMQTALAVNLEKVFTKTLYYFEQLLTARDLSHLKFDHILEVVDMTNRFRRFGQKFFGCECEELKTALEKQTIRYFVRYHRERLEELRMFLENEVFALCPVPYQFTIFDLQEFQFLKEARGDEIARNDSESSTEYSVMSVDTVNPFGREEEKRAKKRTMSHASSSGSVGEIASDELPTPTTHRDLVPNYEEPADHVPPNLCNTALNLLRLFGRYLRMTALLPALNDRSLPAVTQLFNYFFYSVYHLFGTDGPEVSRVSPSLRRSLGVIKEHLISDEETDEQLYRLPPPQLSCAVQLQYPDQLFAASERIMAIESLEFAARQLDLMRPVIESLIQGTDERLFSLLNNFYSQVLSVVGEMRILVLSCVAEKALMSPVLVDKVSHTRWDLNELQSQHSAYVDFLLQDLDVFSRRLKDVSLSVSLSVETKNLLWDRIIYYAFHALVQGYSESSSKCSSEGRALMQLDLQHLLGKLETMSGLKPVPHSSFVDGYIKAYYLPESSLEQWILQHSEYNTKQLINLLSATSHVSKKVKSRIISTLKSN